MLTFDSVFYARHFGINVFLGFFHHERLKERSKLGFLPILTLDTPGGTACLSPLPCLLSRHLLKHKKSRCYNFKLGATVNRQCDV